MLPAARPPLPFGLGRDPSCSHSRCLQPGTPLPAPGSQLHDQVAAALSALFSTFYATSLRYLGVSEILDWVESNKTIDAWILTGLEQGRGPAEVGNDKNLEVGRGAIKSVLKAALEQEDEAWATSLREVGFSSGMSMAYEGVVSQLKHHKSSPLPCLHTLLTPSGLSMLKSAPLKHAFPICPPRPAPSPAPLLASIRHLLQTGALAGPAWSSSHVWRPQIRKAFARYHAMVKIVAEELVTDPSFSTEYTIFLESISQPLQLLSLISDDFETEFGEGACKGLLGVGEVGGQNLIQIMDFCAARRPSELLKRVKVRVREKREREEREKELERLRAKARLMKVRQDEMELEAAGLDAAVPSLAAKNDEGRAELLDCIERWKDERWKLEKEIKDREWKEGEREREVRANVERAKAAVGAEQTVAGAATAFIQGSSKDLLKVPGPSSDPFASTAPRAVSPSPTSAKGKGKALHPVNGASRAPSRYPSRLPPVAPRPPSPLSKPSSRSSSPAPVPSPLYTPPPSPPPISRRPPSSKRPSSQLTKGSRTRDEYEEEDDDGGCDDTCCATCASEMLQSTMGPILAKRSLDNAAAYAAAAAAAAATTPVPLQIPPPPPPPPFLPLPLTPQNDTPAAKKSKKKKKKAAPIPPPTPPPPPPDPPAPPKTALPPLPVAPPSRLPPPKTTMNGGRPPSFLPLSRFPPPECCPPDRCTGDVANHFIWPELDGLLHETCLAGYKYELIDNLVPPLEFIRDKLAKQYLKMGGFMCAEDGKPKDLRDFVRLAEKGMWTAVSPEVQAFTQRTLAVSLQKLMEVFRAQLGTVCICRLSQHPEVLASARHRLTECEMADRKIPIELPPMDQQKFMKWCHIQLRENNIGGPEWEGLDRSYRVSDFLLSFADAFDAAIDRMVEKNPYVVADDLCTMLEWQGGVRTFDAAMRLGTTPIVEDGTLLVGGGIGVGVGAVVEQGRREEKPLQGWGHLLELSGEARVKGTPFSKILAEGEKKKGNAYFVAGEYQKSIVSFAAASIIHPTDPTYWTNAAAARIKIGTPLQYSEAVSDCTFALYYDSKNVKALYRRGTALAMLGRWGDAIADLTELVLCAPDNQPALDALEWAKRRKV